MNNLSQACGLLCQQDGSEQQQGNEDVGRHRPDDVSRDEKVLEVKDFCQQIRFSSSKTLD